MVQAAPTYASQLCYSSLTACNTHSACAYMDGSPPCVASLASFYTTCASGLANFNSSNLSEVLNNGNPEDGVDQFICDAENAMFGAIPGASGMLCYPNATWCEADPLNPCSTVTPCQLYPAWCGSGMALGFGDQNFGNGGNSWACVTEQVPAGALPQGNEFQCFDTQAHCGACPPYG